jgi:hypothetical protein
MYAAGRYLVKGSFTDVYIVALKSEGKAQAVLALMRRAAAALQRAVAALFHVPQAGIAVH